MNKKCRVCGRTTDLEPQAIFIGMRLSRGDTDWACPAHMSHIYLDCTHCGQRVKNYLPTFAILDVYLKWQFYCALCFANRMCRKFFRGKRARTVKP